MFCHTRCIRIDMPGLSANQHSGLKPPRVSRLPPKSAPLLVRAAFGGQRHQLSSHRRSIFHVSICFVLFPAHLIFIPQSIYMYLFRCSPSCLCERLFVLRVYCWRSRLVCFFRVIFSRRCLLLNIILVTVLHILLFCLNKVCTCSQISALLHLTSLPVCTHSDTVYNYK